MRVCDNSRGIWCQLSLAGRNWTLQLVDSPDIAAMKGTQACKFIKIYQRAIIVFNLK